MFNVDITPFRVTEVCILLFSNIERGNGVAETYFVVLGHNLMFSRIFQQNLSKIVGTFYQLL